MTDGPHPGGLGHRRPIGRPRRLRRHAAARGGLRRRRGRSCVARSSSASTTSTPRSSTATGTVNRRIRAALAPYPEDLVVVSKVGANPGPGGPTELRRPTARELRAPVEDNLRPLGVDRIDGGQFAPRRSRPGLVAEGDQIVDLDDQLAKMIALRDEGKIGAIGSARPLEQLRQALPAGIVCVQNAYCLVDRPSERCSTSA